MPRCLAAPGLLAHVIVSKFGDHLPLYRQEQIFARQGVSLKRSTLCDWLKQSAQLVPPLYQLLHSEIRKSQVIQSDDTPVAVQARGGVAGHQGRVWDYLGDTGHPYTVYDYSPDRKQERPQEFLKGYRAFLQADAYSGYDQLYAGGKIVEVGCWAHVRRKFFEAQTTDVARASYVLGVIRQLYAVEKKSDPAEQRCRIGVGRQLAAAAAVASERERSTVDIAKTMVGARTSRSAAEESNG